MPTTDISLQTQGVTHLLTQVSHGECRKQILAFAGKLRRVLRARGVEDDLIAEAVKEALTEYAPSCFAANQECMRLIEEAMENYLHSEDKGRDILGRILFHFLFESAGGPALVLPDGDPADEEARNVFVPGVIPRPLMRYFLVSVRGSLEGVTPFHSLPLLFGTDLSYVDRHTRDALEIATEYRIGEEGENAPLYFHGFYLDRRVHFLGLSMITDIRNRLREIGPERLLQIMENLQRKRRGAVGTVEMHRPFELRDMEQLMLAVETAVERMEGGMHLCSLPPPASAAQPAAT